MKCMLIFRKVVLPECKLLVSLRVYRSNVMSNNEALTINLFIEGTALQMGIRVVFSMLLLLWICGTVDVWGLTSDD